MRGDTSRRERGIGSALLMALVQVTERGAIAASSMRGQGDEEGADRKAVDAIRRELNSLPIDGRVVIGEGERDEAPMLYIGERVGTEIDVPHGLKVDIALDPLEGTRICAKGMPNAMSVVAISEAGGLLHAPDVYMDKIAIGPGYPEGIIDLDANPADNIRALAHARSVDAREITACVLDRPRHTDLIAAIRSTGASVRLIGDGDVAGVIHAAMRNGEIDVHMGVGGAPEGVLTAVALRCLGGQMQGRLVLDTPERVRRAKEMGIADPNHKYVLEELSHGEVLFSATGVTSGDLLQGVRFAQDRVYTESIVMHFPSGRVHWIRSERRRSDVT